MTEIRWAALLVSAASAAIPAHADTRVVEFNVLNATATLAAPFAVGDSLILDTVVRGRREMRRLAYLAHPAPGGGAAARPTPETAALRTV